mmetsp:Transcript_11600/g.17623  ORF Transcript_11600/g.17623 Transcript_11600/m.17623 type:complete len:263 (+) Transcript_11600:49-837(+)
MHYSFTFNSLDIHVPWINWHISLQSPYPAILACGSVLIYTLLIYIILPSMRPISDKGKLKLQYYAKIHFCLLCFYSAICCFSTLYYLFLSGEIHNLQAYLCNPLPEWLRLLSLSFILSKIWEWGDTAIDIWKGRSVNQIGFLHCYHHATTFFLFLLVENFPGTEKSGMLFNGFVHTLMYYHYAFRLPKVMRPLITAAQIVQLVTVTYIWHISPSSCPAYIDFPKNHLIEFLLPYGMVPVYTVFFIKFFIESYIIGKKNKKKD